MRDSFRCFSSTLLAFVGLTVALVALVVAITGGFEFFVGPLRVSAHRLSGPILIAVTSWVLATVLDRSAILRVGAATHGAIERHARLIAFTLACASFGASISLGTYSAAGSDAAGYLSQSQVIAAGRLRVEADLARRVDWPDATWAFAPLGYRPAQAAGVLVPTYPPGLPLTMAAAAALAGELARFLVVPLLGAAAVFATFVFGLRLHSATTGLAAAAFLATSPIFLFQVVQPMSDVPATAWWTLAFVLVLSTRHVAIVAAGLSASMALLTRPNLIPLLIPLALAVSGWPFRHRPTSDRRLATLAVGLLPSLVFLTWLQLTQYGSLTSSGYGAMGDLFSLSVIPSNLSAYALRFFRGEAPVLVSTALATLIIGVAPRRLNGQPSLMPCLRLATVAIACVLACYLPYAVFTEWSYLRFFLPVLPVVFVVAAALITSAVTRLPSAAQGGAFLLAVTVTAAFNVVLAGREQAFNLRVYEAHYREAGSYLASALPPNGVVFSLQLSASTFYYTGRPVVRWDLLQTDLDRAVSDIAALGAVPLLLVEDREVGDLQRRFPHSAIARLDWVPRADIGTHMHVRLYDPRDRFRTPALTDRVR